MTSLSSKIRIVADSAANVTALSGVDFCAAPLKIIAGGNEFLDTPELNIEGMVDFLKTHKGTSTSSCPNPDEWLTAFGDAELILGVTLSSNISGSYNAAMIAKDIYESDHPDRRVHIVDSLSAGPEETLIVKKLAELVDSGLDYDSICREIDEYQKKTRVLFILESLTNFANNGRVSHTIAKIAGLLGICVIGRASDEGTLEPMHKCRGPKKSMDTVLNEMKKAGFTNGRVHIAHCFNEAGAAELKSKILSEFENACITVAPTGGLCSFYAERNGLLIGYEV